MLPFGTRIDMARTLRKHGVLLLVAAMIVSACSPAADQTASSATTSAAPPAEKKPKPTQVAMQARFQQCRQKLEAAIPSGLVTNASVDNGRPKLWVGPAWRTATPAVQEALARDAACFFLSGDDSSTIKFSIYNANGREVAVWNLTYLVMA